MDLPRLRQFRPVVLTMLLVGLVTFATADVVTYLFVVVLAAIAAGVGFFFIAFPGSRFFNIAFANFLAVYACLFTFFRDANFAVVTGPTVPLAYLMPFAAFLLGAWLRREEIRGIVTAERVREERHLGRVLMWLAPVSAVGGATFFLPAADMSEAELGWALLAAQAAISLVVFGVSRDVCAFLIDTGLLFESFFERMSRLLAPAFAFVTFYSLLVIVFATIYRILDRYSDLPHFAVNGTSRDLSFAESLYFSITTISTVGYGDIVPASDIVRVLVSAQIILGVLLLLFGFSEILSYSRDHRGRG
jgi:voltage-gated potassium channel